MPALVLHGKNMSIIKLRCCEQNLSFGLLIKANYDYERYAINYYDLEIDNACVIDLNCDVDKREWLRKMRDIP